MVRRNFYCLDMEDFKLICMTHTSASGQFWSSYLIKDIEVLEVAQTAASPQWIWFRKYGNCYPERLKMLDITFLKDLIGKERTLPKSTTLTGNEHANSKKFFRLSENYFNLRVLEMKLLNEISLLDIRKYFFSQRVTRCRPNGRNRTGPPCSVSRPTAHAVGPAAADRPRARGCAGCVTARRQRYRRRQTLASKTILAHYAGQ